jgi:PHP family Zn ribbon phosphoesterase
MAMVQIRKSLCSRLVDKIFVLLVVATFFLHASCSTSRELTIPENKKQTNLSAGDIVTVTLKEGQTFQLKITEINEDSIAGLKTGRDGAKIVISYGEIAKLEKYQLNAPLTLMTVGLVLILALAVSVGSFDIGGSSTLGPQGN